MSKLLIGDRVRVYGFRTEPVIGVVTEWQESIEDWVWVKGGHINCAVHVKQCRKLVKKERRRVWVVRNALTGELSLSGSGTNYYFLSEAEAASNLRTYYEAVEFVEVRKAAPCL